MKTIFLGSTTFSAEILNDLLDSSVNVEAVFYIPEYFKISYSEEPVRNYNYADIRSIADSNGIPSFEVDSEKGKRFTDYSKAIEKIAPDVILVMGWYYMIPKTIRVMARYGAWGIHSSLLPKYAGGAPLVWAIIEGCKETGVTLFRMEDGVDDGDIIAQKTIPIEDTDTIREVYDRATTASKELLKQIFVQKKPFTFTPQNKDKTEIYPQRKPEDGLINWNWDNKRIKNFIRAQTKPYPGAFFLVNGKKVIIWDADVTDETFS